MHCRPRRGAVCHRACQAGLGAGDLGRIIQGVAAGIGSIGAGTILKLTDREEIKGLTTAASIG